MTYYTLIETRNGFLVGMLLLQATSQSGTALCWSQLGSNLGSWDRHQKFHKNWEPQEVVLSWNKQTVGNIHIMYVYIYYV
jgi:hypothetical protein